MAALLILLFILIVGPLAVRYGADSRRDETNAFNRRPVHHPREGRHRTR